MTKLKKYQQKRKFTKTSEPKGKIGKARKTELIYVIQKHWASHLHWDLRLEWQGVLMSWAIPKEPKNDSTKRLAVQTEDHPLEYADFEGQIPEGEYGAGKVKIWDNGIWIPEDIKKEKIVFELKGKKLKGRFALIRFKTKERTQAKNWLFFKLKK